MALEWMDKKIKIIEIYSNKLHTNVVGGAFLSWMCGITSWSLNEPRKEVAGSFLQCEYLLAFVFSFSCSPHNECDPPSWKTIHLQNQEWCSKDSIYCLPLSHSKLNNTTKGTCLNLTWNNHLHFTQKLREINNLIIIYITVLLSITLWAVFTEDFVSYIVHN